jgi:hypothetical protein
MIKILCDVKFQDNIEQFLTLLKKESNDGCRWDDICLFLGIKKSDELCNNGVVHDCGLRVNLERNLKEYSASTEKSLLYKQLEPCYKIEEYILKE